MKHLSEVYQEIELEKEKEEFKSIIDKPFLTPEEIWQSYPNNFYKWRAKHDLPRILKHFSEKLNCFEEWKAEYNISNEMLIGFGISNCINPNPSKDKNKFIVESVYDGHKTRFISYQNINKKFYRMGPNVVDHKVISSFIGYIDWCYSKGIKLMSDWSDNNILSRYSSSHPPGQAHLNKVYILKDMELLKIGGLEIPKDQYGMIKPKYFEFVNADYLILTDRISTQGHQLVFENSYVDHLNCQNLDLALVEFRYSRISNFYAENSNIQQWSFVLSPVRGKAYNTDFNNVSIQGAPFDVDLKDSTFFEVDARALAERDIAFENTYRLFKNVYADQGDDKKAIEYFLLEKEVIRERVRRDIFNYRPWGLYTETPRERITNKAKHILTQTILYIQLWINNFYWGYGRKPFRVVRNSFIIILLFSVIYYLFQSHMTIPNGEKVMTFLDSIYYSTVTFTTLGYGDFSPKGFLRVIAAVEALSGALSLGFLVAGFSNFKY